MKTELLQSLFHDIRDHGSARIKKAKLLWLLDRVHETPTVWDMLMKQWRMFDPARSLHGLHWGDEITLTMAQSHDIARDWTTRRKEIEPALLQLALVS